MIAGVFVSANYDVMSWLDREPAAATASSNDDGKNAAAESGDTPKTADVEKAAPADVSGIWTLTNRIESSDTARFKDLALGFRLQLKQAGDRVTGSGAKVSENGRAVGKGRRTPISVEGTIEARQLELKFTERGAQRASSGTLSLELTDEGTLRGTFSSDAANARGTTEAQRAR